MNYVSTEIDLVTVLEAILTSRQLREKLVQVIARFVVIFGINTTSDISKLLYVISRAVRRVKFETILKYHKWYLCQISRTNHTIICLYYYQQKVCNFNMQVFQIKLKYHCSKPIKLQIKLQIESKLQIKFAEQKIANQIFLVLVQIS